MPGPDSNLTTGLAEISHGLDAQPQDLRIAGQCLLDWVGVTLAGWDTAPVRAVRAVAAAEGRTREVPMIGSSERLPARASALVHGTAAHALDFDDVHLRSRVHPSAPVLPVVWALGGGSTGRESALAFLAGVEVQSRLARAMGEGHYAAGWHNTATLGCFGAAAAAARLLGLDLAQTGAALGLAATMAAGLRASFGTPAKPLHAGRAAETGILAARLAQAGMTAAEDAIAGKGGYGLLTSDHVNVAAALAPRDMLEAQDIMFKFHASCYGTQAPIEAALRLKAGGMADRGPIHVEIEPQYVDVCCIPDPADGAQTRFSIRHCVALVLAGRNTMAESSFSDEAAADAELAALRQRVSVTGNPAIARANATIRAADNVPIHVDASRPERDLDLQEARLVEKFATLAEGRLPVGLPPIRVAAELLGLAGQARLRDLRERLAR